MPDSLKPGVSVITSFSDGEQPTSAKLNTLGLQLKNATEQLESAVGDMRSQSWPYHAVNQATLSQAYGKTRAGGIDVVNAEARKLDIANISRLIGPASNLNPLMLETTTITAEVVSSGLHQFSLRYPISGPIVDGANPVFAGGTFATDLKVIGPHELVNSGDYYVSQDGQVYTFDITTATTVNYTTDPLQEQGGLSYPNARYNVIPDPNQTSAGGNGITVNALGATRAGRHVCTLPVVSAQQVNILGTTSATSAALDMNHGVQLRLPSVLDSWSAPVGDLIPEGFMYLKNVSTGKVYTEASYYWYSNTAFDTSGIDLTTEIAAGNVFAVITVGTDITTAISDLQQKHFHTHNRDFGEPFIPISSISEITSLPGASGGFTGSEIPGNFAPQYLHRDGYRNGVDVNLNDSNAMRGHLMMGISGGTAGAILGITGATYRLRFGSDNSVDSFIWRNAADELELRGTSETEGLVLEAHGSAAYTVIRSVPLKVDEGLVGDKGAAGTSGFDTLYNEINKFPRPYSTYADILVDQASTTSITLDTFTVGVETVMSIDVLVAEEGDKAGAPATAETWYAPLSSVGYAYTVHLDTSAAKPAIVFSWTGASWPSGPADNRAIRLIVWYA